MSVLIKECETCGQAFLGGPSARFCITCREERKKKTNAEYNRREKEGKARKIGSIDICQNCGKEYTIASGKQMYCEGCGPKVIKKNQAVHKLAEYHENKDVLNPIRNARRRVPARRCAICGNDFPARGPKKYCCNECYLKAMEAMRPIYEKRRQIKSREQKAREAQQNSGEKDDV